VLVLDSQAQTVPLVHRNPGRGSLKTRWCLRGTQWGARVCVGGRSFFRHPGKALWGLR